MLPLELKKKLLLGLYEADHWNRSDDYACKAGCPSCCTRSVNMTNLEGELISNYLKDSDRGGLILAMLNESEPSAAFPRQTTNQFAWSCLQGEAVSAEDDWDFSPCPLLVKEQCAIYAVRPFVCRSLVSLADCRRSGSASMPPEVFTLNTVMMQVIEHLDAGNVWGNMLDVLAAMNAKHDEERGSMSSDRSNRLLVAQMIPGLLLDEPERRAVREQFQDVLELIRTDLISAGQNPDDFPFHYFDF